MSKLFNQINLVYDHFLPSPISSVEVIVSQFHLQHLFLSRNFECRFQYTYLWKYDKFTRLSKWIIF